MRQPENIYYEEPDTRRDGVPVTVAVSKQSFKNNVLAARAHIHHNIEILYCIKGDFCAFLNGVEYRFKQGDMLLIHSREIHNIFVMDCPENSYYVFKIDPKLLYNSSGEVFETRFALPFTIGNAGRQRLFKKQDLERDGIPRLIENIVRENSEKGYGHELAVKADTINLLLWILRYWEREQVDLHLEIGDSLINSFYRILNYINQNYKSDISVNECSEMANLSYSYFSRLFKKTTGQSFNEYLNNLRCSEAERLLVTTDKTVTEVAMECGFSDTCYFIAKFKSLKGATPKQFKKRYGL